LVKKKAAVNTKKGTWNIPAEKVRLKGGNEAIVRRAGVEVKRSLTIWKKAATFTEERGKN